MAKLHFLRKRLLVVSTFLHVQFQCGSAQTTVGANASDVTGGAITGGQNITPSGTEEAGAGPSLDNDLSWSFVLRPSGYRYASF